MQKRFDENVAAVVEAVKDRELRAQLEKSSRRKLQDARGEARDELNAALVQTLADSQSDLGVSTGQQPPPQRRQPSARRQNPRSRFQQARRPAPHRRQHRRNRSRPSADESRRRSNHRRRRPAARNHLRVAVAPQRHRHSKPSENPAGDEINVIGSTVEEATGRVDKFLDEAALANRRASA